MRDGDPDEGVPDDVDGDLVTWLGDLDLTEGSDESDSTTGGGE